MTQKIKDFVDFIRTQGVVGLAIGFILGDKVKNVVTSLVNDIITPFLGLILGSGGSFKDLSFSLGAVTVTYGNFLSTLLDFIIVAAVVYYIIKGIGLDKLDKPKE